jgi:hypothetical protein
VTQLNKVINVYSRRTLKLVRQLFGHTDHVWSIDLNNKLIVSGSWDASVKVMLLLLQLKRQK